VNKVCTPDPSYSTHQNIEFFYSIGGGSSINDNYYMSYTTDGNLVGNSQTLSSVGIYDSNNVASLASLLTPEISFSFEGLGLNHYGIYFRVNFYANCPGSTG
jgi:hypothetical protein